MMRKTNKLQSHYGHPAVLNENGAHVLIHDEFASIWNNISSFNTAILKILPSTTIPKFQFQVSISDFNLILNFKVWGLIPRRA